MTASGHHVIRIRELPLPALTPNDIVCTADQPAEVIADVVCEKIVRLTGRSDCGPFAEPDAPDAAPLCLFADTDETAPADRSGAGTRPLAVLLTQMVRELHRGDVVADVELAQHLVWGLPLDGAFMTVRQQVGGLRALASAAKMLIN